MDIDRKLIEKYFNRECTSEEVDLVAAYLKNNPEVLEKHLSEEEWLNFNTVNKLPINVSEQMLHCIEKKINMQHETNIKTWRNSWATYLSVAASILLICSLGFLYFNSNKKVSSQKFAAKRDSSILKTEEFEWVKNYSGKKMNFVLEDGSEVTLYNNSELKFSKPFKANRRDLFLTGKAFFKVFKNKSKPFTVTAAGLATTALGTQFLITAYPNSKIKSVKLLEGKVVIKPCLQLTELGIKTAYLIPGEEFKFNSETKIASLKSAIKEEIEPQTIENPVLAFQDEALKQVFAKIEEKYKVKIVMSSDDFSTMYFTGKFNTKQDSANDVLNVITSLNNLQLKITDDGYLISKH